MHQTKQETIQFLDECYLKLEDNGYLIFDYPYSTLQVYKLD
ncbi:hypothetical protein [Chryseobacterium sp.]